MQLQILTAQLTFKNTPFISFFIKPQNFLHNYSASSNITEELSLFGYKVILLDVLFQYFYNYHSVGFFRITDFKILKLTGL